MSPERIRAVKNKVRQAPLKRPVSVTVFSTGITSLLLCAVILLAGCTGKGNSPAVNASSYLGDYSYDSSISAMVYEEMDGEGKGIQYREVTDYDKMIAYSPIPVCLYFYSSLRSDTGNVTAGVEQLAEEYHDRILFVSVDADQEKDLASHFEIQLLPDFVLLENGSLKASFSGFDKKAWTAVDLSNWVTANSGIS